MPNELVARPGQYPYVFIYLDPHDFFGQMVKQAVSPWIGVQASGSTVAHLYERYRMHYSQTSLHVPVEISVGIVRTLPRDTRFTIPDSLYLLRAFIVSSKGHSVDDTTAFSILYPVKHARNQFASLVAFTLHAWRVNAIRLNTTDAEVLTAKHSMYLDYVDEHFPIEREL